jgi:hypothetical protein
LAIPLLQSLFFTDTTKAYIRPGTPFDFNLLEQQRTNIVDLYKNEGYYYFSKDDVSYLADSSMFEKEILLDLYIGSTPGQIQPRKFTPQYLNHFYISVLPGSVPVSSAQSSFSQFSDTLQWENHTLYSSPDVMYRPALFNSLLQMESGSVYRLDDARHTFDAFNRLRQFRFIDIQFSEPDFPVDTNLLDCHIRLAPMSKQASLLILKGQIPRGIWAWQETSITSTGICSAGQKFCR